MVASRRALRAEKSAAAGRPQTVAGAIGKQDGAFVLVHSRPMPTERGALAAAADSDGRIYAIGGGNSSALLNTVEAYDPSINSWSTVAPDRIEGDLYFASQSLGSVDAQVQDGSGDDYLMLAIYGLADRNVHAQIDGGGGFDMAGATRNV